MCSVDLLGTYSLRARAYREDCEDLAVFQSLLELELARSWDGRIGRAQGAPKSEDFL